MEVQERNEAVRKALYLTNTAYLLADVANTYIRDSEAVLATMGKGFHYGEKKKFNECMRTLRNARNTTKDLANPIYQISDSEDALDDSDFLYEVLKLVIDRTGDNLESKRKVFKAVKRLKSSMGLYDIIKSKNEYDV